MHTILPQSVGTVIDPLKCFPPRAHKYTEPPRRKSCNFHIKASVVLADTWVVPKIEHQVTPCNHVWKVQIYQANGVAESLQERWCTLFLVQANDFARLEFFESYTLPLMGHSLLMRSCSPGSKYLDFPNCMVTYKKYWPICEGRQ